jgi:hypothetical protein
MPDSLGYPFDTYEVITAEDHHGGIFMDQFQRRVPLCAKRFVRHYAERHAVPLAEGYVLAVPFGASSEDGKERCGVGKEDLAYLWATVKAGDNYHGA